MKQRVLVLDDDPDILDIISYILTEKGFQVLSLEEGKDIFKTIEIFKPYLVLIDVMLGDMDGRLICRELKTKSETLGLPVIFISATYDLAQSVLQEGGPNDFIAKPFDIDKLADTVDKLIGNSAI